MIGFEQVLFVYLSIITVLLALFLFIFTISKKNGTRAMSRSLFLLILGVLFLVLADPYLQEDEKSESVAFYVDVSDSMNERVADEVLNRVRGSEIKDSITIYAFEGTEQLQRAASDQINFKALKDTLSQTGKSDLSQVVRHAAQDKVLLLSDGYQTQGDLLSQIASSGVSLFPILPEGVEREETGVLLKQLVAPLTAPAEKRLPVKVTLENNSSSDTSGVLKIEQDGDSIFQERVRVGTGKSEVFATESRAEKAGISEIVATFLPDDSAQSEKVLRRYITRLPEESVLVLNGAADDARYLETVLKRNGYKLTSHTSRVPEDIMRQGNIYQSVVLNNISNEMLGQLVNQDIATYVAGGGSLVMIGGNRSFGLGEYQDTPVARALPVELVTPKREQKRLNVAVELVLDKSRSMSFGSKIEYAKEAAREVIRNLKDEDYIGVIGFDTTPFIVFPLRRLAENRSMALSRVGSLFPVGRTNLFPAIDEARRSLVQVKAGRKHMIILTDGKIPDGGPHYLDLVENMRTRGITVSTVMMGSEADTGLLRSMAKRGGGAFYQTADARSLPRIFLSDIKVSTGEKTMREQRNYVVRKGPDGIRSTAIQRFPDVRGYVETKIKNGASQELIAFAAGTGEPLYASWQYEKGKAAAFTSDVSGRWTPEWIRWQLFDRFWSDVLESLQSEVANTSQIEFDLRHTIRNGKLELDLTLYSEVSPSSIRVEMSTPDGKSAQYVFEERAPGRYVSNIPLRISGKHEFKISLEKETLPVVAIDVPATVFGEQRGQGYNTPFLYEVAAKSGGKVNPNLKDLLQNQSVEKQKHYVGHWLFLLAALLLFLRILHRETHKWDAPLFQKIPQ